VAIDRFPRIAIVDDNPDVRRLVRRILQSQGDYKISEATNGREAIELAHSERPNLIILDLMMPEMDGYEFMRAHRHEANTPIILLTARVDDDERVIGLELGADDYVTKPFSAAELRARVRAQLRRSRAGPRAGDAGPVELDGLAVDLARRVLSRSGAEIHLTPTEWDLLRAFVANAGRTLTHDQIFRAVWGRAGGGDPQAYLRVHVANLRRKIERDPVRPTLIVTEPGVGYRFRALD
jgi:two-component system KDP operon response regulator KdpE